MRRCGGKVWWQPGAMCRNLVVVATKGTLLGLGCHYHDLEKTQGKKTLYFEDMLH
jgi:hypothetical protein